MIIGITGGTGSGKSTTQACLIDRINRTRECHIVTLEDPIEYLHRHNKSIVSQREISIDTKDYLAALRACVRQAPDVILPGIWVNSFFSSSAVSLGANFRKGSTASRQGFPDRFSIS